MARTLSSLLTLTLALLTAACSDDKVPELRVMTWTDYLRPELVKEFEEATKSRVKLDYFSSNEELLAKVQASVAAGGRGYDLILPSDYMVSGMKRLGLLRPIERAKLTFLVDFDPTFLAPEYDPKIEYAVPFAWGTTGLAVNTKLLPNFDAKKGLSWKDAFENPAFKGKLSILDDVREASHAALLALGKTWASAKPADLEQAFAYLKKHKSQIKLVTAEARPVIAAGECGLCQAFSGDVLQMQEGKPEIQYVIPKEGATIWTDNFAMPKNAERTELAYQFLNHLLSGDGAAKFTTVTHYATPNERARTALSEKMRGLYLEPTVRKKLAYIPERPELLQLMDKLWTEFRSAAE